MEHRKILNKGLVHRKEMEKTTIQSPLHENQDKHLLIILHIRWRNISHTKGCYAKDAFETFHSAVLIVESGYVIQIRLR